MKIMDQASFYRRHGKSGADRKTGKNLVEIEKISIRLIELHEKS
jgi:hypothetical protein